MKRSLLFYFAALSFIFSATHFKAQAILTNPCGAPVPPQQWEAEFQKLVSQYMADQQSNMNSQNSQIQSPQFTIPVIIHMIHGGQAIGTYPNLAQGQLNSQVQVLNDDYSGIGYNTGNYPATAFTTWATNQALPAANKDGNGRVKIANCGILFCLATKDTAGNTLAEPGIDRVNFVTKGWTDPASFTTNASLKAYIDGTIKPATIWNVKKYLNIWVTDENIGAIGLLGYATFPPLSTLSGITSSGTNTTDGFWCYAKSFGSVVTFPTGFYYPNYDKGRVCTHEIGHYLGLRHIWGDGNCLTDYCNDTPPGSSNNFTGTYPYKVGSCSSPSNSPDGEMFMNFMDYPTDNLKYMFTVDQSIRIQTAMLNSPYRNQLGTHGLCSVGAPNVTAAFSTSTNSLCPNATLTAVNNTTGSPTPSYTWSSNPAGAIFIPNANAVNPSVTFTASGTYSLVLSANNGASSSVTQTINVTAPPNVVISNSSQTVCPGVVITYTASGADTYTWSTGSNNAAVSYTPSGSATYSVTGTSTLTGCSKTATASVTTNSTTVVTAASTNTQLCGPSGGSATLTASGATSYTWNPGALTGTSVVVSPTVSTTYTLIGSSGGCNGNTTILINYSTTPNIGVTVSTPTSCAGDPVTFTASGATTYSWSNNGFTSAVVVYSPVVATTYTVWGYNGGCMSAPMTASVSVFALPFMNLTAPSPTVCAGNSIMLTITGGATSYTWQPGGTNGTTASYTPAINTTYTVTGTNAQGCMNSAAKTITVLPCSGILQIGNENAGYIVYPNPTNDKLNVSITTSKPINITIEMVDMSGKVVVKQTVGFSKSSSNHIVNMNQLAAGVYYLKLTSSEAGSQSIKVVKE